MHTPTYTSVWKNCLEIIKENVVPQSYKTWFEPIKPTKLEDNVLTIEVPSQFFYEWLEEHYVSLLRKTIRHELGKEGRLEYSIVMDNAHNNSKPFTVNIPGKNNDIPKNSTVALPGNIGSPIRNPFIIPGLRKVNVEPQLNLIYSFDNFVEGECNRLARSAGYAVAGKPGGTSFNPLLIYGGVGLGKTHLVHAIGIEIKNKFPNLTVLCVQCEKFINQFTESIKTGNSNDFVHFYQMMDVLIIDDIHFLGGKQKTQDVFFHIFNHLHQTGKQLILTADKIPADIDGIEQRVLSRFKWGLSADLQIPDWETRVAILKKKIHTDGIELPEEIIEYIAYSITNNIREMEGVLISILAQSSLNRKSITMELAKQMIENFVKNTPQEVSIDFIQKVVCDYFHLAVDTVRSKARKREVVQARQIAMYFAKNMTKLSLSTIGVQCGGKDHATVLHACRTVGNLMDSDRKFRSSINEIQKKINLHSK